MAKETEAAGVPDAVKKEVGKTYVTTSFRDKDNFDKVYEVDQDVSDLKAERIAELVKAGVAETFIEPAKPVDQKPA